MKSLRFKKIMTISFVLSLMLTLFAAIGTYSQEPLTSSALLRKLHPGGLQLAPTTTNLFSEKHHYNKTLGVEFKMFDSLANAYSYFSDEIQPLIYHASTNTLVTIKRGFVDIATNPGYTGNNSKDNLFVRTSTDMGKNWSIPEIVYSTQTSAFNNKPARYPSVYVFEDFDNIFTFVYSAAITSGSGWAGVINGIYSSGTDPSNVYNLNFSFEGQSYGWGTDDKILGGLNASGDMYAFAIGGVLPPGGTQWSNNSNIATRYTTDFGTWKGSIPPEWASSKFDPVTKDSTRTNNIVEMRKGAGNKIYMAAFGSFINDDIANKTNFGVSVSEDYGVTWGPFEIAPYAKLQSYIQSLGISSDTAYIPYNSKDFVVFDNGDYSFIAQLYQGLDTNIVPYDQQVHQLIEVYKESGVWGVRKIADISGYYLAYLDSLNQTTTNQMDIELQASRTIDGSKLLCKWVDFVDATDTAGNVIKNYTTDIMVASRDAGSKTWNKQIDITQSEEYDRTTWIPDYLPNDLKNIPILKTQSFVKSTENFRITERKLETPQYVLSGVFDFVVGVEEETQQKGNLEISEIYPNPAQNFTSLNFTLPGSGNASLELFNAFGQKVSTPYNSFTNAGFHSMTINTNNLSTGTYYCTLSFKGQKITKLITIVR